MWGESLMRFAMVTTFYPPYGFGGDATYVRALSRELVSRGHEVEVIHCLDAFELLRPGARPAAIEENDGVVVHRLRHRLGALSPIVTQQTGHPGLKARALRRLLDNRFDVVNFHNISLIGGPAALKLSRASATLFTLHEHWLLCATHVFWKNKSRACDKRECIACSIRSGIPPQLWRYTNLLYRALEHCDLLISPSEYTATRHRQAGITRPISVLPLFSAIDLPTPAPKDLPLAGPYFLYAGRVTASKGVEPLVGAFAERPGHNLVVAGDGDLLSRLQDAYASAPNIKFVGAITQDELASLYRGATALVVPSLAPETFCLSVVEAAALGTPSLVRAGSGGPVEILTRGSGGRVYADEHHLGLELDQLANDTRLAQALGRQARLAYERFYTRDRHVDGYLQHVERILARKAPNASGAAEPMTTRGGGNHLW